MKSDWKKSETPWGTVYQLISNNCKVVMTLWKDSAPTTLMSTVHKPITLDLEQIDRLELQNMPVGAEIGPEGDYTNRQRTRHRSNNTVQQAFPQGKFKYNLEVPTCFADYNDNMNAVDNFDHLRSGNPGLRRQRLGAWRPLWNFLMNVTLVNSYLLWKKPRKNSVPGEYRRLLSLRLLDEAYRQKSSNGGLEDHDVSMGNSIDPAPQLLQVEQHHKKGYRGKSQDCVVCRRRPDPVPQRVTKRAILGEKDPNIQSGAPHKKRTSYGCLKCNVAICKDGNCYDLHCK